MQSIWTYVSYHNSEVGRRVLHSSERLCRVWSATCLSSLFFDTHHILPSCALHLDTFGISDIVGGAFVIPSTTVAPYHFRRIISTYHVLEQTNVPIVRTRYWCINHPSCWNPILTFEGSTYYVKDVACTFLACLPSISLRAGGKLWFFPLASFRIVVLSMYEKYAFWTGLE